jgi:hypothetical protein
MAMYGPVSPRSIYDHYPAYNNGWGYFTPNNHMEFERSSMYSIAAAERAYRNMLEMESLVGMFAKNVPEGFAKQYSEAQR